MRQREALEASAGGRCDRYLEMLTEKEICADPKLGRLVSVKELRAARKRRLITSVAGKRGMNLYHPDDIAAYLARKERPCLTDCGNTGATGSDASATRPDFTPAGTTLAEDAKLAEHLVRKFSTKPKTGSSSLSVPRPSTEAARPTAS